MPKHVELISFQNITFVRIFESVNYKIQKFDTCIKVSKIKENERIYDIEVLDNLYSQHIAQNLLNNNNI